MPKAPGTAGTIVALPLLFLLALMPYFGQILAVIILFVTGCYICQFTMNKVGEDDPGIVVYDEIIGYCATMCLVPLTVTTVLVGFILFRFFDIVKPWPISAVDRTLKNGFGVMLDDLLAGVFSCFILHGLISINLI